MKKRDIEILTQKSNSHQQTLAKEDAEKNEMKAAIASLSAQRDAHLITKQSLTEQIAETQKQIEAHMASQRARAREIDAQTRFNIPELDFWEHVLCMSVEGAGIDDHLKVVFTHIDERDYNREAFFELDFSKRDYEIPYCKPKLEREQIERVLDKTNESRDLRHMFKGMRELFVEAMKN
jgi:kinetochore protein Spc25